MKTKTLSLFIISLLIFSCTKEINIDLEFGKEQVVVEGMIHPNYPVLLSLSKTQGYFKEFSENELMEIGITDANVKVIRNSDKEEITLNFEEITLNFLPLGIYTDYSSFNPDFARFGESYKLQIIWNNDTITANTTIPFVENENINMIDSVWFIEDKHFPGYGDFYFYYNDPDTMGNNIMLESKRIAHWENGKFSPDFKFVKALWGSVRNDFEGLNGISFESMFERGESNLLSMNHIYEEKDPNHGNFKAHHFEINEENDTVWHKADTVIIRFSQLDKASFEFWRSIEIQNGMNNNPFGEPQNLKSNIKGGIGIWEGKGCVYFKVVAQKDTIFKTRYEPKINKLEFL